MLLQCKTLIELQNLTVTYSVFLGKGINLASLQVFLILKVNKIKYNQSIKPCMLQQLNMRVDLDTHVNNTQIIDSKKQF